LAIKKTLTEAEQRKRDELEQKPKQGHRDDFDASTVYDWDVLGKRLDELERKMDGVAGLFYTNGEMHVNAFLWLESHNKQLQSLEDRFTALLDRQTEQEKELSALASTVAEQTMKIETLGSLFLKAIGLEAEEPATTN
jgi:Tfp pilus assembly PilM family ATPase